MFKNITLKKAFATFLILLTINTPCMATNWVTITAENGKSADLDLDSIKMAVDTVEYDIRTEKGEFVFINRLSTELYETGTPTALILSTKYKDNNKLSSETYEERNYRELKAGTLQAEIFDVLSKELTIKAFSKGQNTWEKYLKKQRKLIQKGWKPGSFKYLNSAHIKKIDGSPVYQDTVELKVNQDGNVQKKEVEDYYLLYNVTKLEPLPDNYSGQTFTISVDMNYYKYAGKTKTKKPLVTQVSPTKATVKISKNSRPPVIGHIEYGLLMAERSMEKLSKADFVTKVPMWLFLPMLPINFVTMLLGATGVALCTILFIITGGDYDDI